MPSSRGSGNQLAHASSAHVSHVSSARVASAHRDARGGQCTPVSPGDGSPGHPGHPGHSWYASGSFGITAIRTARPERVKEIVRTMRTMNVLAAPIGSEEYLLLLLHHGITGLDDNIDASGNPTLTDTGQSDSRPWGAGTVTVPNPFSVTNAPYSVTSASKGNVISQAWVDGLAEILRGNQPPSTLDQLVADGRNSQRRHSQRRHSQRAQQWWRPDAHRVSAAFAAAQA
jgi:hypothetical protein